MGKIGTTELLVVLAIVLVIFGPKALPKLGRSLGKTLGSFRKGMNDSADDDDDDEEEVVVKKKKKKTVDKKAKATTAIRTLRSLKAAIAPGPRIGAEINALKAHPSDKLTIAELDEAAFCPNTM